MNARALLTCAACAFLFVASCGHRDVPPPLEAAAPLDAALADASLEAAADASEDAASDAGLVSTDPFGTPRTITRTLCGGVAGKHVSEHDLRTSFVNGDDLLAIVNRSPTGQLASDWSPSDLVDVRSGDTKQAADCDKALCLRKEAAGALGELLGEMKKRGFPGKVESAYRGYGTQCGTFLHWAGKGSFCDATEQSALPGHSQHQLGTTVDLFTEEWAKDERGVFREGFGCTPAGKFLQEHATEFGFVMPYPIHPDDRHPKQTCVVRWDIPTGINPKTGYRFEHWHLRYVGKDAATRFSKMFQASGPGTPNEITVEQWLRSEKGLSGPDAELPVCDGCNCGACSTLAGNGDSSCDKHGGALHLDEHGRPLAAVGPPQIAAATAGNGKKWKGELVEVHVTIPQGVVTQPPVVGPDGSGYAAGATFEKLAPYPDTQPRAFAPLAGAWVVGVEPVPNEASTPWPWRAALTVSGVGQIYNRADVLLPTHAGALTLRVPIPEGVKKIRVVLLEGGAPRGEPIDVSLTRFAIPDGGE